MKETELGRFAGPYQKIPFKNNYIQSPIGLVPKSGGKTRLIFHLSYKFHNGNESVNFCTPEEDCTVKYKDLDEAVRQCLHLLKESGENCLVFAKFDLISAFRILPILVSHRRYLIMKAEHPIDGQYYYFIDKCLPFGASISCKHFQRFSNALTAVVQHVITLKLKIRNPPITNYLDDFLFIYLRKMLCNSMVRIFLEVCGWINCLVSLEKTEWASPYMVFLGILLDSKHLTLAVPVEKKEEILDILRKFAVRKKATVKELQKLTGHLNFLCRVIVTGRTFTRRMYAKYDHQQTGTPSKTLSSRSFGWQI